MTQKYRLNNLGWYNFERLSQTLLKAVIGAGVRSFGGSKDKGRDATFKGAVNFPSKDAKWSGYWVFQVKFIDYEEIASNEAQSRLRSELCGEMKKILRRKVRKPDNYILITNLSVSSENRDKLDEISLDCGFIENYATIDGEDICQLLDIFPDIRRSFPQLLGLADLEQLIHSDVYNRSLAYFQEWSPRLSKFVETDAYFRTNTILKKYHFVVIDGPPEVGKSMIGAACAFSYSIEGYAIFDISKPDDLYRIHRSDKKQLYIADDAVGSISYDPGLTDSWAREFGKIFTLLNKDHKLIWTTRKYILQEATHESKIGDNISNFPGIHEITVEISSFTFLQRAEILYNHAKFGFLDESSKKIIKDNAEKIINHPNYTPERIRQLISNVIVKNSENDHVSEIMWEQINSFFNDPGVHWEKAYNKLNFSEKALLESLFDFNSSAKIKDLNEAYDHRIENKIGEPLHFNEVLDRLDRSFISVDTSKYYGKSVRFQHPSLRDLLLSRLQKNSAALLKHIEIASPTAIEEIIRGFGTQFTNNENRKHLISLTSDQQLTMLISRIDSFSQGILSENEWDSILSSIGLLVPQEEESNSENKKQISLEDFTRSKKGVVISHTLRSFGSENTYSNCRTYNFSTWVRLIQKFYFSAKSVFPAPRIEYLHEISKEAKPTSINSETIFDFLVLVKKYEPILYSQINPTDIISQIEDTVLENLDTLIDQGEILSESDRELIDPDEYNRWDDTSRSHIQFCEMFYNWLSKIGPTSDIEKLRNLRQQIKSPLEDDEEIESEEETENNYWTIQRIFEDL
jgi:hypothetical protein